MNEHGCTEVPDPDKPPFSRDQSNGTLPAIFLTNATNAQPNLAAGPAERPPILNTLNVSESRRSEPDDLVGLQ